MNPTMRAKVQVESVLQTGWGEVLTLSAVYTGTKEDNSFSEATPSAKFELTITNKELHKKFTPGQKFYVDFIPAE